MGRYRVLSHTADTGIETTGATLEEVIENVVYAMFDLMYGQEIGEDAVSFTFELAPPPELLVAVLSELLFQSEVGQLAFDDVGARFDGDSLVIEARSRPVSELQGPPIKAVTYHDLRCEPSDDGWHARVIFDV